MTEREENMGPSVQVIFWHNMVDDFPRGFPQNQEECDQNGHSDQVCEEILRNASIGILDVEETRVARVVFVVQIALGIVFVRHDVCYYFFQQKYSSHSFFRQLAER